MNHEDQHDKTSGTDGKGSINLPVACRIWGRQQVMLHFTQDKFETSK